MLVFNHLNCMNCCLYKFKSSLPHRHKQNNGFYWKIGLKCANNIIMWGIYMVKTLLKWWKIVYVCIRQSGDWNDFYTLYLGLMIIFIYSCFDIYIYINMVLMMTLCTVSSISWLFTVTKKESGAQTFIWGFTLLLSLSNLCGSAQGHLRYCVALNVAAAKNCGAGFPPIIKDDQIFPTLEEIS